VLSTGARSVASIMREYLNRCVYAVPRLSRCSRDRSAKTIALRLRKSLLQPVVWTMLRLLGVGRLLIRADVDCDAVSEGSSEGRSLIGGANADLDDVSLKAATLSVSSSKSSSSTPSVSTTQSALATSESLEGPIAVT